MKAAAVSETFRWMHICTDQFKKQAFSCSVITLRAGFSVHRIFLEHLIQSLLVLLIKDQNVLLLLKQFRASI